MLRPCLTLCSTCKHYNELDNKALCDKGIFTLTIADGRISVPMDYECMSYDKKDNGLLNGKL